MTFLNRFLDWLSVHLEVSLSNFIDSSVVGLTLFPYRMVFYLVLLDFASRLCSLSFLVLGSFLALSIIFYAEKYLCFCLDLS